MDFTNVISILEEEKHDLVSYMRKLKRSKKKFPTFDAISRKVSGDMTYGEEISNCEREIEELKEAIRILRLSSE